MMAMERRKLTKSPKPIEPVVSESDELEPTADEKAELARFKIDQALRRYKMLLRKGQLWVTKPDNRPR